MEANVSTELLQGGEFLIKETKAENIFTPEDHTEDQKMVITMIKDFIKSRVAPNIDKIESLDIPLTVKLIEEMGELGILGIPIPEEYGGSQMDFVTNILLTELMSECRSFALSYGAHTSIGMLPILYFGTEEQKQKYLVPLAAGTKQAAYCLTEPGSGSDSLAAKTKAVLTEDGKHYIMNGQKMWITNAGFADVFVVFAKIDGEHFTGFIVERDWEGVSLGAEEKKMGIKGSSTCQVFFENVKVPVENVLGLKGKGHRIAFNILNVGRIKLAAGAIGGTKIISTNSIKYANERKQFGKSISSFAIIQHKLAEQAIRTWVNESAIYRASYDIKLKEESLLEEGKPMNEALLAGAEEFSIECAILKVHGSECLDYVIDEGVQIMGGMGYSEETPMAATYRDARINRIFEGTNEINRMLSVDQVFRRTLKGKLDLMSAAKAVQKEIMSMPSFDENSNGYTLSREKKIVRNLKKVFMLVAGASVQHFMQKFEDEQEMLVYLSDIMADIYLSESAMLRCEKIINKVGAEEAQVYVDMMQVFIDDAIERCHLNAKRAISSWAEGDMKRTLLMGLKRFAKYDTVNSKTARRRIAAKLIDANEYCF